MWLFDCVFSMLYSVTTVGIIHYRGCHRYIILWAREFNWDTFLILWHMLYSHRLLLCDVRDQRIVLLFP